MTGRPLLLSLLAVALVAGGALWACAPGRAPRVAAYGAKVSFRAGVPIAFPDLTLTYLGERRVESQAYPRGFLFHDFRAERGSEAVTVSWTSGTGVIDSADFTIGGRAYALELRGARAHGWLDDDELVLTPADGEPRR